MECQELQPKKWWVRAQVIYDLVSMLINFALILKIIRNTIGAFLILQINLFYTPRPQC